MNLKLLHYSDLAKLGYGSRVTIWRKFKAGKFPAPVMVDGRPAWREQDVIEFFEALKPITQ